MLTQIRNAAFGSVVSQYDYTYDAEGRRTSITRSGTAMSEARTDDYGYNPRGELISATKRNGSETLGSGTSPVRPGVGADSTSEVLGAPSRSDVDGPSSVPEYAYQYDWRLRSQRLVQEFTQEVRGTKGRVRAFGREFSVEGDRRSVSCAKPTS